MGNLNQGQGTIYSNLIGPSGIIIINEGTQGSTIAEESHAGAQSPIVVEETSITVEETSIAVEESSISEKNTETQHVENLPPCCTMCKKKLGLANQFKCRCENIYCAKHMHSFNHECTFDYKKFNKERLMKENPLIKQKHQLDF
jgi:hypothetical protein